MSMGKFAKGYKSVQNSCKGDNACKDSFGSSIEKFYSLLKLKSPGSGF